MSHVDHLSFSEYLAFLQEHLTILRDYQRHTSDALMDLGQLLDDLKSPDPFVVFDATLCASNLLNDKGIYN